MRFDSRVKYDGCWYNAGEDVPIKVASPVSHTDTITSTDKEITAENKADTTATKGGRRKKN